MSHIPSMDWPNAMRAEAADALPASTEPQASTAASSEDLEIRRSRLFYIRRYGPIMGMCLYELDASLRASGGSARR
jgi:hypothetical protein